MAEISSSSAGAAVTTTEHEIKDETTHSTSSINVKANNQDNSLPSEEDVRTLGDRKGPSNITKDGASVSAADATSDDRTQTHICPSVADVVSVLEKHLLAVRDELMKIDSDPTDSETSSEAGEETYLGKVVRLPMSDWMGKTFLDPIPRTVAIRAYYREVLASQTRTSEAASTNPGSSQGFEKPQRIAISSSYLASELVGITNMSMNTLPILMKPPYKAFIQFWPDIQKRLAKLKAELLKFQSKNAAEPEVKTTSENETTEKALDDTNDDHSDIGSKDESWLRWRISHLETLHNFIETELGDQLKLRTKIENGTIESMAFEDLWQLFSPGDILYSRDQGFEQLYKAYAVTGGQIRLRNRTSNEAENVKKLTDARRDRKMRSRRWNPSSESDLDHGVSDSEDDWNTYPRGAAIGVGTWTSLTIDCFSIGMDSTRLGAIDWYKRIQWYTGKRKLTDLPILPLRFLPDKDDVVQRLETRGLRCVHCYGHKKYDGFAYDAKGRSKRERLQGDVFVDFAEYYRRKRTGEPRLGVLQRTTPDQTEVEEGTDKNVHRFSMDHEVDQHNSDVWLASLLLETQPRTREEVARNKEQLSLMRHQVVAFAFRSRKWVRLEIDFVEDIDKSDEARKSGFEDLIILPKYRRLLVSLVDSHSSNTQKQGEGVKKEDRPLNQLDLVRGKGLGLIVLLHGPPGTGKTSTAETIASYTGRPLYSITCGDLGESPYRVEQRLEKHTSRADKWGCVLLLDEADVFLMRRDFLNASRNALVSIFLRTLEYYSGILFLTTNRVGVIDEAFKSRIHVALRYPKVKLPTTLAIWKGCLDRIEKDNEFRDINVEFDRNELMEFAEEHYDKYRKKHSAWNGRQIRNAFQTAIAMGQYERTRKIRKKGLTEEEALATGKSKWRVIQLTRNNLETIAETAQDFDKYMKSVHKFPDVEIAKADQLRDDDFSESSEGEEYVIQKLPVVKQSSGRREGSKKHALAVKKSGKSVATSSSRAAARSSNQATKQKDQSSSDSDLPAKGAAQTSSDPETTDDDI
ncbi:hypothetical protein F4781DRAFT_434236 [Annulohypoxylon bovei var. microspora]|nr:hypothetical protein F4781DRAFT_434236 [Annulohypoxylon bovei var. microspora]